MRSFSRLREKRQGAARFEIDLVSIQRLSGEQQPSEAAELSLTDSPTLHNRTRPPKADLFGGSDNMVMLEVPNPNSTEVKRTPAIPIMLATLTN
ncbi:MAG: hypothetical protein ACKO7W_06510 [Elainella sp.]